MAKKLALTNAPWTRAGVPRPVEVGRSGPRSALAQAAAIDRVVGGDPVQSVVLIFPIDVVSASGGFGFERRDRFGNPNEPVAVRIGQRPQHHGVHNAENRRIGTNAERQGKHGHQRKGGILAEHPYRVAQVLDEGVNDVRGADGAAFLFHLIESPEPQPRPPARCLGLHARRDIVGNLLLQMEAKLYIKMFLCEPSAEEALIPAHNVVSYPAVLRIKATALVSCSQFSTSASKCFRPLGVSA